MNKQILLALLILFTVAFSLTAISASDVNVTDSHATSLVDDAQDVSVPVEKTADISQDNVSDDSNVVDDSSKVSLSSDEVLESEDSNNLSINIESDKIVNKDSGTAVLKSVNTKFVSSEIDLSKTIQASDITKYYKGTAKYTATFYDKNGNALANTNVKIIVNGKTYTKTTDANGMVSLAINLKPGTYKVLAENPVTGYQMTTNFKILSTISAKSISKVYTDGRKFSAKFYKSNGKVLANKYIKFKINGKTYKKKTNAKGVASLSLKSLKKGTYKIISCNKDGLTKTNKIKVYNRVKSKFVANPYIFLKKTKSKVIKAKLLNSLGYAPYAGKIVKIKINKRIYTRHTKSSGLVSLKLPTLKAGLYTVKYSFAGTIRYKATSATTKVVITATKNVNFVVKSGTTFTDGVKNTFKVLVKAGSIPLPGKKVAFNVEGKKYTKTTNKNGIVSLGISAVGSGKHIITYSVSKTAKNNAKTQSTEIEVIPTAASVKSMSVGNIVAAANTVKNYYAKNSKLPGSVMVGGYKFTMPEFLYVLSKSIAQIGAGNHGGVPVLSGIGNAKNPSGDKISSAQLKTFVTVAKNVAAYLEKNKQAPNYASSDVGKINYNELVDAFSRVLAFYGSNNNQLPSYVVITQSGSDSGGGGGGSQSGSGLNEKNTISDLSAYLKATTHCQVGNSAIKNIVKSVTSGATTALAKAKAIYNYVRDHISYSFYYNTKHGAVGTLSAKSGNCVDQAHLLIAMFRTAGLPARYVHGTCTFSDGTFGHVWTQVVIGNQWYVCDPTSPRNSFGTIVNWNTKSYSIHGKYISISF